VARGSAFMHDGRFATLAQVIEHYNSGVQPGPSLDPRLISPGGPPRRLNLSASDKQGLVDFLGTLNDDTLATDARFTTPFLR
jgi:cytochrome c peroxidase